MPTTPCTATGARRTHPVASPLAKEPSAVETWAKRLHHGGWYRRTVAAGTKGPRAADCTTRPLPRGRDSQPRSTVGWGLKRPMGAHPSSGSAVSKAPLSPR